MNFRPPRRQSLDINMAPLIDCVFLLLIFFMLTSTFVKQSKIDLTLPQASEEVKNAPPDSVEVAITKDGAIYVNDKALVNSQVATVRQAMARARKATGKRDPVVIIRADARTAHQSVIDVMDAARQIGLYRITFPTRVRDKD